VSLDAACHFYILDRPPMKTHHLLTLLPLLGLASMAAVAHVQSNGAPMGHTQAPGELTCNRSGCHVGPALNSGPATLSVDLGTATGYQPGMVYPVTVSLTQPGVQRFGFQMLALQDDDTTNAGTFRITDATRTRILDGLQQFNGRQYVTYTYPGTAPAAPGEGRWTFEWQAPVGTSSPVSFYTAAVVADNDGTDQGDTVYTKVLTLPALPTAQEPASAEALASTLYPNPSHGVLHLRYMASGKGGTRIALQSTTGTQRLELLSRMDPPGQHTWSADLRGRLPAGSYVLQLTQGARSVSHPFILLP
jgi:hypothetical protein